MKNHDDALGFARFTYANNLPDLNGAELDAAVETPATRLMALNEADWQNMHDGSLNGVPICCFVGNQLGNRLVWSHYANGHRGYCVEFNMNAARGFFARCNKVTYSSEYPSISKPPNVGATSTLNYCT